MKAARLHGARDLRIDDLPEPGRPGPGEALVEVRAVGVCGSDIHYYNEGGIGTTRLEAPMVVGHEPAGVVLEVGEGVSHVQPGDRVAIDPAMPCGTCENCRLGHPNLCPDIRFFGSAPVDGALRERLVHPVECLFALPDELSLVAGALCEALGVAIHAVDLGHLRPGVSVAIAGCGPVGLMALQVARCAGAAGVFVSDPVPERRAVARSLGADLAIDAADDFAAAVAAATNGRGVDVAFDCATSNVTQAQCCELAKLGGTVVLCGIPPVEEFCLQHSVARRKGLTIKFARRMKHTYPRALELARRGLVQLDALATHRYPLAQVVAAFETAAAMRDGVVKAVIEW